MARARNLKPSFFTNELLGSCPAWVRLLFEGLWCLADREGRLEDRPARIKAEVLPYDDEDVAAGLAMLAEKGFIERYEVKGRSFIHIVNFHKHQHPHPKETCGNYPGPSGNFRKLQETSGKVLANKAQGHSLAPSCNYSKFPEISGNYQAAQTVANNVDSSKYPTTYTSYVYANCENKPCNFLKFQEVLAFPSYYLSSYYLSSSFFLSAAQKEILKSSSSSSRVGVQGEGEIPKRDDDDDDNLTFSKQPRRQTPKQRQSPDAVPEAAFLEAWNACPHFSPARNLQGDRLTQFRARCREPDWLEHWREALVRAQQSTFCCGQRQGWHATIDWFLRPDTVTRLLEGFYDDRRKQTPMEEFTEALKRKLEEQKNR